jgi:hypothetical protein
MDTYSGAYLAFHGKKRPMSAAQAVQSLCAVSVGRERMARIAI